MSCPVDSYYNEEILTSCGACTVGYDKCGDYFSLLGIKIPYPGCCPWGTYYVGETECNNCKFNLATVGKQFKCKRMEPLMDEGRKIQCCLDKNLPSTGPQGYCASGWCPNSDNCISFFRSYCTGDNLQTDDCKYFCRSHPGMCDEALKKYCHDSKNFDKEVCGCALPLSEYPFTRINTPENISIPITCDKRCDNSDAIRLQGQQDCNIGSVCILNAEDVKIIESHIDKIKINQNCGPSPSPPSPSSPPSPPHDVSPSTPSYAPPSILSFKEFLSTRTGKISLLILIIVLIIILINISVSVFLRNNK